MPEPAAAFQLSLLNPASAAICQRRGGGRHCEDGQAASADAVRQPQDEQAEVVRVRLTWSEIVTREAYRDLDASRMRRLGYDSRDPESIRRYLEDADGFDGADWYPWHSEFGEHARHIGTDDAEISSVGIEP
jgi:hypothetical protein